MGASSGRLASLVGWRYVSSRAEHSFVGFISLVSMVGIALGVAVLIVVLSVMNGFEQELRERILSLASHATLEGLDGRLDDWPAVREGALEQPRVQAAAPFVEARGMLLGEQGLSGVVVRGVVPHLESTVADLVSLNEPLRALEAGSYGIVLGSALAQELGVTTGDRVMLLTPEARVTPAGLLPRMKRFEVSGIFSVGMYEFDRALAYVHLVDAQRLYRLGESVSGVRLKVDELYEARRIGREVAVALNGGYYVDDWSSSHRNFFHAISLTRNVLFVVLSLIVAIAAFNIVSTLMLVVREKRGDIAILRTMGASPSQVLRVFVVQGTIIGLIGTLAGVLFGIVLSYSVNSILHTLERLTGWQLLDPSVYFIGDLPAQVVPSEVAAVAALALLLAVASTLYPARRGARTEPARALRND